MANPYIVPAIQLRTWEKNMAAQKILGSVFEQFSSRVMASESQSNEGSGMVPSAIVNYQSDKFNKGVMFTTIPSMDKLKLRGSFGPSKQKGTEETVKLRYARCYYNNQRKAITFGDDSVDGDAVAAYPIASEQNRLMGDYFSELNDWDKHRALILGANDDLTNALSWENSAVFNGVPPVTEMLHVNTFVVGQSTTTPVAWNATFATHVGNLVTAINSANSVSVATFTKTRLDKLIALATKKLQALNWTSGGTKVQYVIVLSQLQADQLQADVTDGGWWKTFVEAGERGTKNKTISGLLGIYRECMLLVDVRAPLFNVSGSGAFTGTALERFQFCKPFADDSAKTYDIDAGDNRIPTTYVYNATPANVVGTAEIGMVLGRGAILEAEVKKLKYTADTDDYDFSKGCEARQAIGMMRCDFTGETKDANAWSTLTVAPNNWTSMLFLSPTVAGTL